MRYYGDFETNPQAWEKLIMTNTISPLHETSSLSYQLIEAVAAFPLVATVRLGRALEQTAGRLRPAKDGPPR